MRLCLSQFFQTPLVDMTLRALVAVAIAGLLAALVRNAAASVRHAIWLAATVVLVTLPIAIFTLPQFPLPLLPAEPIATIAKVEALPLDILQPHESIRESPQAGPDEKRVSDLPPAPIATAQSWLTAGMVIWGAGVLLMTVRTAAGFVRLYQLRRSAEEVNDSAWRQAVEQVKRETRVQRDVRLLQSSCAQVPVSWGIWRIYVCLPTYADGWSANDRHMVLTHELTHARRGDYLWQLLAIGMTAVHWFNPLAWWVAYRLRMEAEIACDDSVIAYGSRPSDYAACLCRMVRAAKASPFRLYPTLSIARSSELPRRLVMILNDKTKHHGTRSRTLFLSAIASVILGSVFGTAHIGRAQTDRDSNVNVAEAKEEGDQPLDHINASPMDMAGVYHVSPVFEKLVDVTVFKRKGFGGAIGTTTLKGWDYDNRTGRLTLMEAVDNESETVLVRGNRQVPWAWQIHEAICNLKVLIGDRVAVRGEDYEVDEAAGTVQFLKAEHCKENVCYCVRYHFRDKPGKGGTIGNHPDSALVQRYLGLPSAPDNSEDFGKAIGADASRTDDPMIWTIMSPVRTNSIKVALGRRSEKGKLKWLEHGKDFAYDEGLATITLVHNAPTEEDSWMFVSGIPAERGRFLFHAELRKVRVVLGGRRLEEGIGFEVDHERGIVTILDAAIEEQVAEYFIFADGRVCGNQRLTEHISQLLKD